MVRLATICVVLSIPPLCAQSGTPVFPMEKGTTWIYEGSVEWQEGDTIRRTQLTWNTDVVDTSENGRYRVAALQGHPLDLAWYGADTKRNCYILTAVDNREFYLHPEDPNSVCMAPREKFDDLAKRDDLIFKLPAQVGDHFGGDPNRDDTMYSWLVEDRNQATRAGVNGVEYKLIYRSLPEHHIATYVPGVGLTSYVYSHHGTHSEVDMRLVEVHKPQRSDRRPALPFYARNEPGGEGWAYGRWWVVKPIAKPSHKLNPTRTDP